MLLRGGARAGKANKGTPGWQLRELVRVGAASGGSAWGGVVPLVGAPNAYAALLAQRAGLPALYLSGSTLSASSLGLPDLGVATLDEVVEDARRITRVCSLPLLVDVDTGFGGVLSVARTVQELENVGVAGIHIEDQETEHKRCGHRPNKRITSTAEMVDRLQAAVAARRDQSFVIMARTDAFASEGLNAALKRARAYIDAGADMLFPEALGDVESFKAFTKAFPYTPVLANLTEFGRTPLLTLKELSKAKVSLALFPVTAFRAMARAAEQVYTTIAKEGTQSPVLPLMQTREELYNVLDYHSYEVALDKLYPSAVPEAIPTPTAAAPPTKETAASAKEEAVKHDEGEEEEEEDGEEAKVGELIEVEENGHKVVPSSSSPPSQQQAATSTEAPAQPKEPEPPSHKETEEEDNQQMKQKQEEEEEEEEAKQDKEHHDDEEEEDEDEDEEEEDEDEDEDGKKKKKKIVATPGSAAAELDAGVEIVIK